MFLVIEKGFAICKAFFCKFDEITKTNIMKYYLKWFNDFGISVYPVNKFKNGFDLVLLFVTISIDYNRNNGDSNTKEDKET